MNELNEYMEDLISYADDSLLAIESATEQCGINSIKSKMSTFIQWIAFSKLVINDSKTEFMVFTKQNSQSKLIHNAITVNGVNIPRKNTLRFVGTTFQYDLKWTEHIHGLTADLKRRSNLLRQLSRYLTPSLQKQLFHAIFMGRLLCDIQVWFCPSMTNKQKYSLQVVMNSAMRATLRVRFDREKSHTYYCNRLGCLTLDSYANYMLASNANRVVFTNKPSMLSENMMKLKPKEGCTRASHAGKYNTKLTNKIGSTAFSVRATNILNTIDFSNTDPDSFKNKMKKYLMEAQNQNLG